MDARSGFLILVLLFGWFLFGWLHTNQDSFHALPALRFCDHELMGFDGRFHLLELHNGALLGPHLAVPATDPPDIRRQLSPGFEDSHRRDDSKGPEELEQVFHHLLLHPSILLGGGQGPELRGQVEVIDQEHLAGEVLAGEEWDRGGPPHLPVVLIQLEGH